MNTRSLPLAEEWPLGLHRVASEVQCCSYFLVAAWISRPARQTDPLCNPGQARSPPCPDGTHWAQRDRRRIMRLSVFLYLLFCLVPLPQTPGLSPAKGRPPGLPGVANRVRGCSYFVFCMVPPNGRTPFGPEGPASDPGQHWTRTDPLLTQEGPIGSNVILVSSC